MTTWQAAPDPDDFHIFRSWDCSENTCASLNLQKVKTVPQNESGERR